MSSTSARTVATIALALWLLGPPAAAAYDPATSLIDADAPLILTGRSDALVSQSIASFVSNDPADALIVALAATELTVAPRSTNASDCSPTPIAITCPASGTRNEAPITLTSASVTVTKTLTAYKLLATNDAQYAKAPAFVGGTLVASTDGTAYLAGTSKPSSISPSDPTWDATGQRAPGEDRYTVDANEASLTTSSGATSSIAGKGGLHVLLQGVRAHVHGIASDGSSYDRDLDTRAPSASGERTTFVILETKDGRLAATSAAPLTAYGIRTLDLRGAAALTNVQGNVTKDGETRSYQKQDASLDGPVSFAIQKVATPPGSSTPRLTLALSSDLRVAALTPDAPKDETTRLVAAGVAGAGGAALLAGALYFWPRLKFAATLLLLPLYSRIERTTVLDHEKRDEIYELIRVSPGIHAHEIGQRTQIGWGTTVHHLKLLETHNLIVSKKSGRYKRFFVNTGEYTKKKDLYGALRNETAKAIADFIADHPGCNQKELCAALNIQPSLASWHVERLEGVELVKRVKDGRMVRYFAGAAWAQINVRTMPEGDVNPPVET